MRSTFLFVIIAAIPIIPVAASPAVSVTAAVASHRLFVGGEVDLQIRIDGSDHPGKPRFPSHNGFTTTFLGGSTTDSTSITIVNGNETTVRNTGYVYRYSLSAEHTGRLTIPPIAVPVNGRSYRTNPIRLTVSRPLKTSAFLLGLSLSRHSVYVGEPVVLTVDWYISRDVSSVSFNLPILHGRAFRSKSIAPGGSSHSTLQLPLGGGSVTATRGTAVENGRTYTRIRFKRLLIPREPGHYDFANSSAQFVTQNPASSLFGSFFGSSSSRRTWVIPGTALKIDVKRLPTAGRPADFTGLVGSGFSLSATAMPRTVNVGDPISLSITLKGGEGIEGAEIPALSAIPGFAAAFSLPAGQPSGTLHGRRKTFTQTIRARSDRVRRIPPVEVPYFDPSSGRYALLRSKAIGIRVRPTHILTAHDLQGAPTPAAAAGRTPRTSTRGIDYNYEGRNLLTHAAYAPAAFLTRPGPVAIAATPLAAFLVLFGFARLRRRSRLSRRNRTRGPARDVLSLCESAGDREADAIFAAFRRYLQIRFELSVRVPEFSDVQPRLGSDELSSRVGGLYSLYEKLCFAPDGELGDAGVERLSDECARIVTQLERGPDR